MGAEGTSLKTVAKRLNAERIPPFRARIGRPQGGWCLTQRSESRDYLVELWNGFRTENVARWIVKRLTSRPHLSSSWPKSGSAVTTLLATHDSQHTAIARSASSPMYLSSAH